MADRNVTVALERFTWRMLSQYVSQWEFEQLKQKIQAWDQWCEEWSKAAAKHADIGDKAAQAGNGVTAGDAYVRAALYYHWASFLFVHDQKQWRAAMEAMDACWKKAAPLVSPPMELCEIPFEGVPLPGYLRRPEGVKKPPLVILVPGGDSTKEELYDFGDHILKRGIAVFAFDGPGQGLVSTRIKLRPRHAAQAHLYAGMRRIHPHQRSARQRALQLLGLCRVQHRWATQRVVDMHKAQTRLASQALHHGRARGGGDVGGEPEQHGRRLRGLHQRRSQQQAPQCHAQNQRLHGLAGSAAPAPASAGATPVSGM